MPAFHFRLERVLTWRRTELRIAEAQLERLQGELRAIEAAAEAVPRRLEAAQNSVTQSGSVRGSDLASIETFRQWSLREGRRLAACAVEARKAIAKQTDAVVLARRGVKLVERLKERRRDAWKADADHELEAMAGEFAVSQWRRDRD
jgi:flagellar export protein FliJ